MVSKYDVIRAFRMAKEKNTPTYLLLSEDEKSILDAENGEHICSIETYVQHLRKKYHCDFECIFHEHASLTTIYRCNECGAIIFTGDDERYDPNLKCPVCAGYNHSDYWTKEEIDADEKKQKEIQFYIDYMDDMAEQEKRRKARGGKYDWEIWNKTFYGKKRCYRIELQDFGRHLGVSKINPNYKRPWYQWNLEMHFDIGEKDGMGYAMTKLHRIPLSPYAFYLKYIFPYSKKCSPDLRKYYPWQKKPEESK